MPSTPLEAPADDVEMIPLAEPEEQPQDELLAELLPVPSDDVQRELWATITADHDAARLDREDWEKKLVGWEDAYLGNLPDKDFPWPGCSNLHVPLTMLGIETLKPRLVEAVLGGDQPVYAIPTEATDEERQQRVELFLNWQLPNELNLPELVEESAHIFLNPGIVIAKVLWRTEIRKVKALRKFPLTVDLAKVWESLFGSDIPDNWDQDGKLTWRGTVTDPSGLVRNLSARLKPTETELQVLLDKEEVLRDCPDISLLPPEDFYAPFKGGADVQRLPWCGQNLYYTEDDLRWKVKQGRFYKDAVEALLGDKPDGDTVDATTSNEIKDQREETQGVTTDPTSSVKQSEYLVKEDYRKWDIDDDGFQEEIVVWVSPTLPDRILGWDYLDNVNAHGRRPFVIGRYLKRPFCFYPLSFPEVISGIQDEINAIHNQRVDNGTIQNTPFGFIRASATTRGETVQFKPGVFLPLDNPAQDVNMPRWQGTPAFGQNEESLLYQYFERLTGLTDLALGRQPNRVGATRTASGTAALLSEAGLRFKTSMEAFQRFWVEIFEHVLALDQQYLPPGKEFRVTGRLPEILKIDDREAIRGRFNLRLSTTTETMNKQVLRDDATAKLNIVSNPLFIQSGQIGMKGFRRLLTQYLRAYGEQDPSMVLEPEQMPVVHTPEEELQIWASGGDVDPTMLENIQMHLETHMSQLQMPEVQQVPGVVEKITKHLGKTMQIAQMQAMANQMGQGGGKGGPSGPGASPVAGEQAVNAQIGRTAPGQVGPAGGGGVPA